MPDAPLNLAALEPLYAPHDEPNRHRVRAERDGEPAKIVRGRRKSDIVIAQNLRSFVRTWREVDYAGASDTTRELLHHWFERDHLVDDGEGGRVPFRYYFCQREAIETLIYLYEFRRLKSLAGIVEEFGGENSFAAALGVNPETDRWAKYAFKMATGAGKTKVMSLAMVWSYFHALRESDSPMAKHFVVIAPNLTVYERLREDFAPAAGGPDVFAKDPLIPVEWRGDWNLSVVLQDEAGGAATGGTLYLTNIHRLYDPVKRKTSRVPKMHGFVGPDVSRAKALDTGEALRERVTSHERVMVLNDECHHLWDPGSAWNEAISFLHSRIGERTGGGISAQLDFSATPKDNHNQPFQHIVCDAPLYEAVDAGIVKTPVLGRAKGLKERSSTNASERFEEHLMLGYLRWQKSRDEWKKSGKKTLMFVMTEDTEAADQIARRLNSDSQFKDLNGKTVNLHTNLKGKVKWTGGRAHGYPEFVEDEKEISEDDLKELRRLSRELDSGKSPYQCIVSVLMLREGWDVRNVTTIVPLRPYTSPANILPEQTLGRGLRRMVPHESVAEIVTVVEHPAFVDFYRQQLEQEGLSLEVVDVEQVPSTTVSIFPDQEKKDVRALDVLIPSVGEEYRRIPVLQGLTMDDVRQAFKKYKQLPLGQARSDEIEYEGRQLFTNEIVEAMKLYLPLLESGAGAVSFYRQELEYITHIRGTHPVLAPMIETFLTEMLFEEKVSLFDPRLVGRLADDDVRQHVHAVFVPLIRARTTERLERGSRGSGVAVSGWRPFQVTHSRTHPALPATRTPFNLVPCNRELEVAMCQFLDRAPEVAAFCKNAGPQAVRVDHLTGNGRLALYTPDFLVRLTDGACMMVETKGRVDKDVPLKARAAVSWCAAAAKSGVKWEYVYVPEGIFKQLSGDSLKALQRACQPALQDLVVEPEVPQLTLPFGEGHAEASIGEFISAEDFARLPPVHQKVITQAVTLYEFLAGKGDMPFAPVFVPLLGSLDEAARGAIVDLLLSAMPEDTASQRVFFAPPLDGAPASDERYLSQQAANLRRTLVDRNGVMPIGLLKWCLEYARGTKRGLAGVFGAVRDGFAEASKTDLTEMVGRVYGFRNRYVAHQKEELTDIDLTRQALAEWATCLCRVWALHH
ncbi:MAG: DEAD/DEAH box helicase family protein [candidate division WOR-3 bacterium]|nr:DEAD/DEAH box helicase family protein [candidate division WOR-3 bacterium]